MRVLLTGVNSFAGRAIAQDLSAGDHEVLGTYRTADERLDQVAGLANLELVQVALEDHEAVNALPGELDAIIHCAAAANHIGLSAGDYIRGNVISTQNLVELGKTVGIKKFILLSSLSVHGEIETSEVVETTPINNADLYGATKYLAERLLADCADVFPSIAIRLPAILGKGAHRSWLPGLIEKIKQEDAISVFNPDALFNNAVLASDLSRFCLNLLSRNWTGHAALPIGADGTVTIRQIVEILCEGLGRQVRVDEVRSSRVSFTISSTKAVEHFGYEPRPIDELLLTYAKAEAS